MTVLLKDKYRLHNNKKTNDKRSSAIAEGPRDALCRLKSRQLLLHNCTKNRT